MGEHLLESLISSNKHLQSDWGKVVTLTTTVYENTRAHINALYKTSVVGKKKQLTKLVEYQTIEH